MALKVVQDLNVDGLTININPDGIGKLNADVVFTDREVHVQGVNHLVFREIDNHNKNGRAMMVCTGFEYQGKWYGDRPDEGQVIDVLNNQQEIYIDNQGNIAEAPEPVVPKYFFRVVERYNGVLVQWQSAGEAADKIYNVNLNNQLGLHDLTDTVIQTINIGDTVFEEVSAEDTNTLIAYANNFLVEFDMNGKHYRMNLPVVANDGTLRTYEVSGSTFEEVFKAE